MSHDFSISLDEYEKMPYEEYMQAEMIEETEL